MNRRLSREKTMELLFGMTLSKDTVEEAVETFKDNYEGKIKDIDLNYLTKTLIGVQNNINELDDNIKKNLHNWKIDRISKVNLTILRIATYEILFNDDIPKGVAINEALHITRRYSDEKSVAFINGVLDKIN